MVEYKCEICGIIFNKKAHYIRHKNRKFKCKNPLQCDSCGKVFSTKSNLNKHIRNVCNKPQSNENDIDKQIELAKLQLEISKLQGNTINSHNTQINDNSMHIHQHQTVQVQLNAFGKENNEYIIRDTNFLDFALRDREAGAKRMFSRRHFDPDHPENHNIKMTDFSRKKLLVYNGSKWLPTPIHEIESIEGRAAYDIMKDFLERKEASGIEIPQQDVDRFIRIFQDREFQEILSRKGYIVSVSTENMDQSKLIE